MTDKSSAPITEVVRKRGRPRAASEREDAVASVGSLSRGLLVLDVLRQATGFLALSDIAAEAGLDASTTHRLLQVLTETGYAVRDNAQKRYLPGPRALAPLSLLHPVTQLRSEATPLLKMLHDGIGETCALILYLGHERLVLEFTRGNNQLSPYYDTWLRSPLHGTASGKLLLAWMSENERDETVGPGPYTAHTSKTVTEAAALNSELSHVRKQGYALAREEAYQRIISVGVPLVFQAEAQPIGCLTVTAMSKDLPPESEAAIIDKLRDSASFLLMGAPALQMLRGWAPRGVARKN